LVVHIRIAYNGTAEQGEKLLTPLRGTAPTFFDTIGELTYAQAAIIHMDAPAPLPHVQRSAGRAELIEETVDALIRFAGPGPDCQLANIEIRH
jgi:hypothetical protein